MPREKSTPKKRFSQNFLINEGVCKRIVEEALLNGETGVLEIGAGRGALTEALAGACRRVVAVELDFDLMDGLQDLAARLGNVDVVQGDVLALDLAKIIRDRLSGMPVVIVGNLPYHITSPILFKLLEGRVPAQRILVMVQKEAARRLCASPGSRESGASTLAVRYYASPSVLFDIAPGSFYPAPKVHSSVIRLDMLEQPSVMVQDEAMLFRLIRTAFSHRRKTLLNALLHGLDLDKPTLARIMLKANLDPDARPETLTLEDYARLANLLAEGGDMAK